ncbi:MAG: hypothetical protein L0Z62_31800, partial [Gemmataceae bacterium]|nr:hypothetical protein [Gemmataceae bacterium]
AVLAGQLRRCGGGQVVADFEDFAAALDDLWHRPQHWQELGRRGQEYVRQQYGNEASYAQTLVAAVQELRTPLAEQMRRRGLKRAAELECGKWREAFGQLVEDLLEAPPHAYREQVEVTPRVATRTVAAGLETVLLPVRIRNRGTHALVAEGPARHVLRCRVLDATGSVCRARVEATPLPGILVPGQSMAAAVRVCVPAAPGVYPVRFWAERAKAPGVMLDREGRVIPPASVDACAGGNPSEPLFRLVVEDQAGSAAAGCCTPLLHEVQAALQEAEARQRLPDDYLDVTEGLFARWKRRLKQKLLGNFKRAYVDVLSRQQSAFNRQILTALQELAECCATLDHARTVAADVPSDPVPPQAAPASAAVPGGLRSVLGELRVTLAALEERLTQLEAQVGVQDKTRA